MSIKTLRKLARRHGFVLNKIPERSRWFAQYGPITLTDENGCLLRANLTGDDVPVAVAELA